MARTILAISVVLGFFLLVGSWIQQPTARPGPIYKVDNRRLSVAPEQDSQDRSDPPSIEESSESSASDFDGDLELDDLTLSASDDDGHFSFAAYPSGFAGPSSAESVHDEEELSGAGPDESTSQYYRTYNNDIYDDFDEITSIPSQPQFSDELIALREKVRGCLKFYYRRQLDPSVDSAWAIMHSLIGYGVNTQLQMSQRGGKKVNAIGWLCYNGPSAGERMLYTSNGQLQARSGPGLQGHAGQFLAMLAQSRVKIDYPIQVDGKNFTIADLVQLEKRTCESGTELTFKLIGLSHYLESDQSWKNQYGQSWSIPQLIKEELAQPIQSAACGGSHRMMGFSYAVHKRRQRGEPFTGEWLRARKFVDAYLEYTFKLQNGDGSFSSQFFAGRGDWGGIGQKLETMGHVLEWLVFSLPQEKLRDPRTVKAVNFLVELMIQNRHYPWEIGPQGHAIHALALYDQRLFGAEVVQNWEIVAKPRQELKQTDTSSPNHPRQALRKQAPILQR